MFQQMGLHMIPAGAQTPAEIDQAFALMAQERAQAFFTIADPFLFDRRSQITGLASRARIPAVYNSAEYVEAGGLMSYGVNTAEVYRSAAKQVARVLRGEPPAAIPVEQPTQIELVVNLRAAREQAITIPPLILTRADRVLQ
jgi:putative ABC transport system substrate-binding protein